MHTFPSLCLSLSLSPSFAYLCDPFNIPQTPLGIGAKTLPTHLGLCRLGDYMAMELAMELELEDDVFYADISKQISLLIMDEDEQVPVSVCSSVSLQGLFGGNYQTTAMAATALSPYVYEQSCITRESKGTGVFIPRSSQPRRKHHHYNNHKQGRFSSFNSSKPQSHHHHHHHQRQYPQQDNIRSLNNYNSSSSNNSTVHASNPRRTYRDAASIST